MDEPQSRVEDEAGSERMEGAASWTLNGPLAVAVGLMCAWELATWAPNVLTWPLYADHDVFSTAARAWDAGIRPYRELRGNNFPGTTYVFWVLGRLFGFGWAQGPSFYGFDSALVATFGIALVAWSGRRFGRLLPGLIGYGGFLGYYLALDYSQVAQRDWQGPFFAALGLLILQTWAGRTGRLASALVTAFGLIIRPQAVLLLPAQALAAADEARDRDRSAVLAVAEWATFLAVGLGLAFLPLILAGLWPDFLGSLKVVRYGSRYSRVTPVSFALEMIGQLKPLRVDVVPLAIFLLAGRADAATLRTARPWMLALLGVLLYRPLSPQPHAYLTHPLMVVWTVLVAIVAQMVLERVRLPASLRLVAVLLVIGLGLTAKPRFCNPNGSLEAFRLLKAHRKPAAKPTGYARNPDVTAAAYYEWEDYRALLDYLRTKTSPATRVANCLEYVPAITGPTARLPAFPAESVAWLLVVGAADDRDFADDLRDAKDAVVVWAPSEKDHPRWRPLARLAAVIEEHYEPEATFGILEVRRRKPKTTSNRADGNE